MGLATILTVFTAKGAAWIDLPDYPGFTKNRWLTA